MKNNKYILGVGNHGKDRLNILNEVFKKTSEDLLYSSGLAKGKIILEIGCGTGNMTCWLAEQVGSTGHIYALDINNEQIAIAIKQAHEKNLTNITFIKDSILDLNLPDRVDLIYSRLVLMHVPKALQALKLMYTYLKEGGSIVCEEACDSISCYPPSPAYLKSRDLLKKLTEINGLDFNIGEKLYGYFLSMNLNISIMNYIQPIYKSKREKSLVPLFIEEAKDNYLRHSLCTQAEVDDLCEDIYQFVEDNRNLISFPRVMQITGVKN